MINYGYIDNIFFVESQNLYLLKIRSLQNTYYDTLTFKSKRYINRHIIHGDFSQEIFHMVSAGSVIEKGCLYEGADVSYFARFPNLYESS